MALANRRDVAEQPEAVKVREKIARSLQYPEAKGLKHSFLSSVETFYFRNEMGVIEPGASYLADHDRLGRVASRIVKGLFWNQTGERLPKDYVAEAFVDAGLTRIDEPVMQIYREVLNEKPLSVGRGVFKYWYKSTPEDKFASAWVLLFYESIYFYCLTINPQSEPVDRPLN